MTTNRAAATWRIRAGAGEGAETFAAWDSSAGDGPRRVFVCAHGAGGNMTDRAVLAMAGALRAHGIDVVRFDFFYRARGAGRPDPMPRLLECYLAVLERVRTELRPDVVVIGGRSMGGRAASMLAAERRVCDGVLLLAYPLHPPGDHTRLRASHLPSITVPVLCLNGTRDPFCDPVLMAQATATLSPSWQMHWLEGADHSFHVLKRSGRTNAEVLAEAADAAAAWFPVGRIAG